MKYFTAQWHSGELSDRAYEAAVTAYEARLRTIAPKLPPSLRLLSREVSLHDGLIEKARVSSHSLALWLRIGDLQRGYTSVHLAYAGVLQPAVLLRPLRQLALIEDELVSDEIDISPEGFAHRLFFSEGIELEVSFKALQVRQSPRKSRRLSIPPHLRVHRATHNAA